MYADNSHIQTLSSTNPSQTDLIKGLLYVPTPKPSGQCDNATISLIPQNVTGLDSLASSQYPIIALAPWTSVACVQSFLQAMSDDAVNGAIFYHPDGSEDKPPPASDPSWNLHDGGQWTSNPFPIYALPGAVGTYIMTALSEYSGDMIDAPNGPELVKQYDPRNFVRLYAQLDVTMSGSIPSLWVFLIIVLAVLLAIVLIATLIMHLFQARQRRALQRRVANGEVDLEALGIKRLNVPQSLLDKMPIYVFTTKSEPSTPAAASISPVRQAPPPTKATREVQFSQPTCPICLDDFVHNETRVRELPCSHIFHPECIDIFLRDNSSLCPMCKKSTLPPGYCPTRVTNLMVRRERLARRMRERAAALQNNDANGHIGPTRRMSMAVAGLGERMRRAPTSTPVQSQSATRETQGTEMSAPPPTTTPGSIDAIGAPPPEIASQGAAARRAWRRERLARAEQSNFEGLTRRLNESDTRPKCKFTSPSDTCLSPPNSMLTSIN